MRGFRGHPGFLGALLSMVGLTSPAGGAAPQPTVKPPRPPKRSHVSARATRSRRFGPHLHKREHERIRRQLERGIIRPTDGGVKKRRAWLADLELRRIGL